MQVAEEQNFSLSLHTTSGSYLEGLTTVHTWSPFFGGWGEEGSSASHHICFPNQYWVILPVQLTPTYLPLGGFLQMQGPHANTLPGSISDMYRPSVQCTRPIPTVEHSHQPDMAYPDPTCL